MCSPPPLSVFFSSFQNPSYGVSVLTEWRGALNDADAFAILMRASWLPAVRRAISTEWDPHDCERLLAVFEAWQSLLPEDLLQHDLLEALVLPRLQVRPPSLYFLILACTVFCHPFAVGWNTY